MNGPYYLAIDVGTSRTSAAIARFAPDGSLLATPFPLGRSGDNAPTVVFAADGELLFGDAAERRGHTQPDRLIREYKRRIGDDVPILAADRAFAPEELYARTVDWAARAVVEREGGSPALLAITVPAAWGEYRSDIVRTALSEQGWRGVVVITEPEAAARHYESTNPLPEGRVLAVYDFGGGTFDAVALRKDADGAVRIVGAPAGIPDLGGADFDDALVRHVVRTARLDTTALAGDTSGRMALAALRRECVDAKESLSFDSEAVVPVLLSGDQRSVRLSRDEFEVMIAEDLDRTVEAFEDALERAGVDLDDVDAILLTGGTSRIPRVAQVLSGGSTARSPSTPTPRRSSPWARPARPPTPPAPQRSPPTMCRRSPPTTTIPRSCPSPTRPPQGPRGAAGSGAHRSRRTSRWGRRSCWRVSASPAPRHWAPPSWELPTVPT